MRTLIALAGAATLSASAGLSPVFAQSAPAPVTIPTPNPYTLLPSPTPGPGTISVRLNVRTNFYAFAGSDSGQNPGYVTPTSSSATNLGSPQTNTKLAEYAFGTYSRIYPGFDGIAANGLKYGAAAEIRQDNNEPPGGGINGSISQNTRNNNTIYYREEYVYLGTDSLGFFRMGVTGGAAYLMAIGTFENFNDGGWNGDVENFFTGNTQVAWPFSTSSGYRHPQKIVYLSPQFSGVDAAVSFEPNTSSGTGSIGNCPYGVTANGGITGPIGGGLQPLGCFTASSTSTGDYTRRRNTLEAYLRYRGSFGPIGVAAAGGIITGGRVIDNSTPAKAVQYQNQVIGDGGFQITYGGFAAGGHVTGGTANASLSSLVPQGEKDEFAWLAGTSYAFGPFIVGASYYNVQSAGSSHNVTSSPFIGNRTEYGIAAGGTYSFARGMNVFLSYLYGARHQNGYDFLSGAASSGTTNFVATHNNVQAQGFAVGTQFRW